MKEMKFLHNFMEAVYVGAVLGIIVYFLMIIFIFLVSLDPSRVSPRIPVDEVPPLIGCIAFLLFFLAAYIEGQKREE